MQQKLLPRPAGIRLSVPSGLTDKTLVYFYPHEIQELIQGLALPRAAPDSPPIDSASGVLLARYLMAKGVLEPKPAAAFSGFDCFIQPRRLHNEQDFIELASLAMGRPQKLRTAIAFTGGDSPSTAVHIYPPHQELPRLLGSLSDFFNESWSGINPVHAVAIVFYFALSIHPFSDGNGRWARHLAAAAARKTGDPWLAAVLLVFFYRHEKHIIALWKKAETDGLDQYVEECMLMHHKISQEVQRLPSRASVSAAFDMLTVRCGPRHAEKLFCSLITKDSLSIKAISAFLQCSQKKAEGIISSLQGVGIGYDFDGCKSELNLKNVMADVCNDIEKIPLID